VRIVSNKYAVLQQKKSILVWGDFEDLKDCLQSLLIFLLHVLRFINGPRSDARTFRNATFDQIRHTTWWGSDVG
jgi:hypothetical protein